MGADAATSRQLGDQGADDRLYALGDLTLGTFLFTFGIPALVERAQDITSHLKALTRESSRPQFAER